MIVIKVYSNYRSNTVVYQQYLKQQIEIKDDLWAFSVAKFTMDSYRLQKYNKVEIYEAWTPDVLKFKWYVQDINKRATILREECEVVCRDAKGLLQNRWALYGFAEVSTPMPTVISNMMDWRNVFGDNWEYQIDYTTPIDM
jgi:hypothetical protein